MKNADPEKIRKYRKLLYGLLAASCLALTFVQYSTYYGKVPDTIKIKAGRQEEFDFKLPASAALYKDAVTASGQPPSNIPSDSIYLELDKPLTFYGDTEQSYHMEIKLFGIVPMKTVKLQVIQEQKLIPAGIPIGIYVKTQGVLVIGTGSFTGEDGVLYEPAKHILKSGDYIKSVNGQSISSKKEFTQAVQNSGSNEVVLGVIRGNENIALKLFPQKSMTDDYKLGIWIRDSAQGIGTMTFIKQNGHFGALGHGINDVDTSTLMNLEGGRLYRTSIVGIRKGQNGTPGELTGSIDYADNNIIGLITENTEKGIFGECSNELLGGISQEAALPIGLKQEVHTGAAQILCDIEGIPTWYDIEILELNENSDNINRGIVLRITDPDLLALTGGIVQGMSGSPIVQEGKIIGAVTHVLVQDSTKGYGIFIENMLMAE